MRDTINVRIFLRIVFLIAGFRGGFLFTTKVFNATWGIVAHRFGRDIWKNIVTVLLNENVYKCV